VNQKEVILMDNLKEKSNKQLCGRLGYMAKICKNECDFDTCDGCNFANETIKIQEELKNRKNS
jgi:hypothetical protein